MASRRCLCSGHNLGMAPPPAQVAPARDASFEDHVAWARSAPVLGVGREPVVGRCVEDPTPWDYEAQAVELVAGDRGPVLDLGTEDGRFFATLAPFPHGSAATETWAPHLPLARRHLQPLGVDLYPVSVEEGPLPFLDSRFSVVLARDEGFDPDEVVRVLRPGGVFLTEQPDSREGIRLCAVLGERLPWDPDEVTMETIAEVATTAGLVVDRVSEHEAERRFTDLGAVLWFLRSRPWFVPGLSDLSDRSIARYETELRALHLYLASGHDFVDEAPRILMRAHLPE